MLIEETTPQLQMKTHKCNICEEEFSWNWQLVGHMQQLHNTTAHLMQKKKSCSQNILLSQEMQGFSQENECMYSQDKPYACQFCPYRAIRKDMVVKHQRIHTGEKPFKCDYCDFSATQQSTIVKHLRIHTGEKPYKCKLCDYSAAQSISVRKHIVRYHPEARHFPLSSP